jgi:acetylglutamate kinase
MIMMTDIGGIMADRDDPDSLIRSITVDEAEKA